MSKQIVEGFLNLIADKTFGSPEEIKKMAHNRAVTCSNCPLNVDNFCSSEKSDNHVRTGVLTKGCGCFLPAKVRSINSNCPLGKW